MKPYRHLSSEERAVLMIEHRNGVSVRAIPQLLEWSPTTISREIRRHTSIFQPVYCATTAAIGYRENRQRSVRPKKLEIDSLLYLLVIDWLVDYQWSPEQISGTLKTHYPDDADMHVSPETIYACIYAHPRGELKKRSSKHCAKARANAAQEALRRVTTAV